MGDHPYGCQNHSAAVCALGCGSSLATEAGICVSVREVASDRYPAPGTADDTPDENDASVRSDRDGEGVVPRRLAAVKRRQYLPTRPESVVEAPVRLVADEREAFRDVALVDAACDDLAVVLDG